MVDLESIMRNKISQTEEDNYHMISLNVESKKQNEQIKTNRHLDTESKLMLPEGRWWEMGGQKRKRG